MTKFRLRNEMRKKENMESMKYMKEKRRYVNIDRNIWKKCKDS